MSDFDEPTDVRVTLILADFAQVADGKLTVVGGGWTFTGPTPSPCGIGIIIEVPWQAVGQRLAFALALVDDDGQPCVWPDGNAVGIGGELEGQRPPGHPEGVALSVPLAVNFGSLPLEPGRRYEWRFEFNGTARPDWRLAFSTRSAITPPEMTF